MLSHKVVKFKKPLYISNKFKQTDTIRELRGNKAKFHLTRSSLSIVSEGFIDRGIRLMNMLDPELRMKKSTGKFRNESKKWVLSNIKVKPSNSDQF